MPGAGGAAEPPGRPASAKASLTRLSTEEDAAHPERLNAEVPSSTPSRLLPAEDDGSSGVDGMDSDDDGQARLVPRAGQTMAGTAKRCSLATAPGPTAPAPEAAARLARQDGVVTAAGTKRRRVSWEPGTLSPVPSLKRLHKKARAASLAQVACLEAEERRERRRKKLPRFRVRQGSRQTPSASAVAVVDHKQLYVTLTNDTLWSQRFGERPDKLASRDAAGGWRYIGSAVRVLDMAADERYLYAVDHSGITWQFDRRHTQGPDGERSTGSDFEAAQWESWDVPTAPTAGNGDGRRHPNRCITLFDGFMYAIDDQHRLLRSAMSDPMPATERQWSTIPAWEAVSLADEKKIPIGVTSSRDSVLVACADGTICALAQRRTSTGTEGNETGTSGEFGSPARVLPLPLLPKVLQTEWLSLAAAPSDRNSQCLLLFAAAVTADKSPQHSKQNHRPTVHCLCNDGDDVWSFYRSSDYGATAVAAVDASSGSGSAASLQWRLENLAIGPLEMPPAIGERQDPSSTGASAKKKQRRSSSGLGAGEREGSNSDSGDGFRTDGHEWIGKKVRRMVIRQVDAVPSIAEAVIVQWWPEGTRKDDPALWKIKYIEQEQEQSHSQQDAVVSSAPDIITEDLEEKEARDAIQSATPEGHAALQALRDRILALDQVAAQRRDVFIRSQPSFAEDQKVGRQSLISGYLVWAFSEGKWWPAQIYTPLAYLHDYLPDKYSHFIARQISQSAKPDSLFVVYLGDRKQFEWAPWHPQSPESQKQQPRKYVKDFRQYRRQYRASVSGASVLKALKEAEDVLNRWLGVGTRGESDHEASADCNADEKVAEPAQREKGRPNPTRSIPSEPKWQKSGHKWVGHQVKRWLCTETPAQSMVNGQPQPQVQVIPEGIHTGIIIAWQPKAKGQPALWKVKFESGCAGGAIREHCEKLNETEARDAIHCDSRDGLAGLIALRKQIVDLESLCIQRRNQFIRKQPAFVEDQRSGRQSLLCGYLVFVKWDDVWWPAQLYTPLIYMKESKLYTHAIAKSILKQMKPDSLFVVFLDEHRSCTWVAAGDVHDFRLHRARHVDYMTSEDLRAALKQADATLAEWIASAGVVGPTASRVAAGDSSSSAKLTRADSIPLSPRDIPANRATKERTSGIISGAMHSTVDMRVTASGETKLTVRCYSARFVASDAAGVRRGTVLSSVERETGSADDFQTNNRDDLCGMAKGASRIESKSSSNDDSGDTDTTLPATGEPQDHGVGERAAADVVMAIRRDAARIVLAHFAKLRLSRLPANRSNVT